ncbi:hypothetical protein [Frigoriglobus tundricola]|uniref:Uncharacterized protein n=1 Tax=Frigoriglobus tundricola TaxID=2774151 RepID=A0A6M5YMT9_9BACT|nr:hypothetical protein [Frigoriglobus tundricola]QJW95377.1 hypothetical protein FTUN_2926 [Frigoriglobus tundricola]
MSVSDVGLPPLWQYYSDHAREAHDGRADEFGQGREEQLNETLRLIESGKPFTNAMRATLDRLPRNRSKKHVRLRVWSFGHAVFSYRDFQEPLIDKVYESLAPAEWLVECKLAGGESYATIAADTGVTEAALKMRVLRWRSALREKAIA